MAQISYTNKVALNENPEIANINKITDDDMNEIKQVVNDNYNNTIQITDTEPSDNDWKIWIDNSLTTDNTYYNDNGTKTQFKTTAYDTLPIGTEVDYDGDTVPTGWTQVNTLVWENDSPTLSFSSQDITLDDTYNKVDVIFERSNSETDRFYVSSAYNVNVYTMAICLSDNKLTSRQIKLNGNTLTFGTGQIYNTYGSSPTSDNTKLIPVKIYGYKE